MLGLRRDWALPFQKFMSSPPPPTSSPTNIGPMRIAGWGGKPIVMYDPYLDLPEGKPYPLKPGFNAALSAPSPRMKAGGSRPRGRRATARRSLLHHRQQGQDACRLLCQRAGERHLYRLPDPGGEYSGLLRGPTRPSSSPRAITPYNSAAVRRSPWARRSSRRTGLICRELLRAEQCSPPTQPRESARRCFKCTSKPLNLTKEIEPFRAESRRLWDERMRQLQELAASDDPPATRPPRSRQSRHTRGHVMKSAVSREIQSMSKSSRHGWRATAGPHRVRTSH